MASSLADIELNIANWLLSYHNTPHSATGTEPSVLMLGRRVRSALSLMHPLSSSRSLKKQIDEDQKLIESKSKLRRFSVGESVLYWNVLKRTWTRSTVLETSGKVYVITTEEGSTVRKHLDHVVLFTSRTADRSDEPAPSVESGRLGRILQISVLNMWSPKQHSFYLTVRAASL